MAYGAVQVEGRRVVNAGANPLGVELGEDLVPPRHADDIKVPDVLVAGEGARRLDAGQSGEQLVVAGGGPAPRLVPRLQAPELGRQDHSLERVEARVEAQLR